jgi:hypothetical protein
MKTWAQDRLLGAHVGRHRHVAVHRHVAPTEQHLALGLDRAFHLLLAGQAAGVLLGQEDHANAVFAGRWQLHTLLAHFLAVQRIGQLDQDTGAVAHQLVGTDRAPVVQVFKNLQALLHDGVRLFALDVRHETHATGVVFVGGVVQTGVLQFSFFRLPWSWRTPKFHREKKHSALQQQCQAK